LYLKGYSPRNENSVITYSPSCCSNQVKLSSFIFGTQLKIFVMKSERFLFLSYATTTLTIEKVHEEIVKLVLSGLVQIV